MMMMMTDSRLSINMENLLLYIKVHRPNSNTAIKRTL